MKTLIDGTISGIIASIIFTAIIENMTFHYDKKIIPLLYELHLQLKLIENGLQYENEIIIYSSINSINNTAQTILRLSNKRIIFGENGNKYKKVINTLCAQLIAFTGYIGQSERGFNTSQERSARINDIQRAFYLNENPDLFSSFTFILLQKLSNNDSIQYMSEYENGSELLNNKMLIEHWRLNNNIKICDTNDEIDRILKIGKYKMS